MNYRKMYSPIALSLTFVSHMMTAQNLSEPVSLNDDSFNYENSFHMRDIYNTPVSYDVTQELKVRVLSFRELQENWDGYGAVPPLAEVINNAVAFINQMPTDYLRNLELEDVLPTPHGTINFDWYNEDDYFCVEVGKNNIGYFSKIRGVKSSTDRATRVSIEDISPIISDLRTLYLGDLVNV